MTRATRTKKARHQATPPTREGRLPRGLLFLAAVAVAGTVAAGALLWNSSSEKTEEVFAGVPFADPDPIHVHGLGINQADGSLFIVTHTGLFRVGKDSRKAVRIADRYQDTMGFSIVGPNRFLGSGHPDAREQKLPPLLGLIESTDAGKTPSDGDSCVSSSNSRSRASALSQRTAVRRRSAGERSLLGSPPGRCAEQVSVGRRGGRSGRRILLEGPEERP